MTAETDIERARERVTKFLSIFLDHFYQNSGGQIMSCNSVPLMADDLRSLLQRVEELEAEKVQLDLWAIHIIGPDEIRPMPSLEDAIDIAHKLNILTRPHVEKTGVCSFASVINWRGSRESHARTLTERGE